MDYRRTRLESYKMVSEKDRKREVDDKKRQMARNILSRKQGK